MPTGTSPPIAVDVLTIDSVRSGVDPDGLVVLVEPLYGSVAIAAAMDAGWSTVELAPETTGTPPIPLASFEVAPPLEHRGAGRCRVRADDLEPVARLVATHAVGAVIVGCVANARPLAARAAGLARDRDIAHVSFLAAPAGTTVLAADAMWASGVLIRILLEELDVPAELTDPAGIAVTLAQGAEDPAAQLTSGTRWRRHIARGGHADDLRVAAAIDSLGVVPRIVLDGEAVVAIQGD